MQVFYFLEEERGCQGQHLLLVVAGDDDKESGGVSFHGIPPWDSLTIAPWGGKCNEGVGRCFSLFRALWAICARYAHDMLAIHLKWSIMNRNKGGYKHDKRKHKHQP